MNILSFQGRINRLQFLVVSLILAVATIALFAALVGLAVLAHGVVTHSSGDTTLAQFTQDIQQHHHAYYSASSVRAGFAPSGILVLAFMLLGCLLTWISFAAQVKRFHDMGQSGRLSLLNLFPGAGLIIWLVLVLAAGQPGANAYDAART